MRKWSAPLKPVEGLKEPSLSFRWQRDFGVTGSQSRLPLYERTTWSFVAIRSHMDPVLQLPILHIEEDEATGPIPRQLLTGHFSKEVFTRWRRGVTGRNVIFHEYYHFWQMLGLPFMSWYSFTFYMVAFGSFPILARTLPPQAWPNSGKIPALEPLSAPRPFALTGDGIVLGASSQSIAELVRAVDGKHEYGTTSVIDLLEGATSYAQWQVQAGNGRAELSSFLRWCKLNPSYQDAFRLAGRIIGNQELTFRCFLPLVCAAFDTSDPVKAFLLLCGQLRAKRAGIERHMSAHPEPLEWDRALDDALSALPFDTDGNFGLYEANGPFFRLDPLLSAYGEWGSARGHPLNGHLTRQWIERMNSSPSFRRVLSMPGWLPGDFVQSSATALEPPATVCRFHRGDETLAVGVWGTAKGAPPDQLKQHLFTGSTIIYGAVRRALGLNMDANVRLCSHRRCDWYETNLCNSYVNVPLRPEDCGYPRSLKWLIDLALQNEVA
jgi:hypothetical protein